MKASAQLSHHVSNNISNLCLVNVHFLLGLKNVQVKYHSPNRVKRASLRGAAWRGASDPHGVVWGSSPMHREKKESPWREARLAIGVWAGRGGCPREWGAVQPREAEPAWGEEDIVQGRCKTSYEQGNWSNHVSLLRIMGPRFLTFGEGSYKYAKGKRTRIKPVYWIGIERTVGTQVQNI